MNSRAFLPLLVILVSAGCTGSKAYLERGNKLFDSGKYEEASLNYRKAIQKDRKSGEAYYKLALSQMRLNQPQNAYADLIRAAELSPGNNTIQIALADSSIRIYRQEPSHPQVLYDRAAKIVTEQPDPNAFDTLRLRGYLAAIDRKPDQAISYLQKANQVRPMQPEVVVALAQALIQNQRFAEAETLCQQLIKSDGQYAPVYDLLYSAYRSNNRPDLAEGVLKSKIANNPSQPEYVLELASYYASAGKRNEISPLIQNLLDRRPPLPRINLQVGNFYASIGDWQEAFRLLEQGAKQYPQ